MESYNITGDQKMKGYKLKDHYVFTLRLEKEMYNDVNNYAHMMRISMADFVREGIILRLNQIKKPLTRDDSTI
jgi:predicted HicB family RNase H-like nuclease